MSGLARKPRVDETERLTGPQKGAVLCMALGAEAVFVGSGVFLSSDPLRRATAIVEATAHPQDFERLLRASTGLGEAMRGREAKKLAPIEQLATRGW